MCYFTIEITVFSATADKITANMLLACNCEYNELCLPVQGHICLCRTYIPIGLWPFGRYTQLPLITSEWSGSIKTLRLYALRVFAGRFHAAVTCLCLQNHGVPQGVSDSREGAWPAGVESGEDGPEARAQAAVRKLLHRRRLCPALHHSCPVLRHPHVAGLVLNV